MKTSIGLSSPAWDRIFRILLFVLPVGILGNIVFTLLKTDFRNLFFSGEFHVRYLGLALLLGFIPWFTNAFRLWRWTRFFNNPVSFSRSLHVVVGADLGSAATPTVMGGGYLKLGMLIQDGYSSGSAASLMVLGSVEDGLFMAVALPLAVWMCGGVGKLGLGPLISAQGLGSFWLILFLVAAVSAAGFFFIRRRRPGKESERKRFRDWRKRFVSDFGLVIRLAFGGGGSVLAGNVVLSGIGWICRYQVVSAFMAFLGARVFPVHFFVYQWIIFTFGMIVATPGGIGGVEAAFCFLFGRVVPQNMLAFSMLGWRMLTTYLQLAVGAVVFMSMNRRAHFERQSIGDLRSDSKVITAAERLLKRTG